VFKGGGAQLGPPLRLGDAREDPQTGGDLWRQTGQGHKVEVALVCRARSRSQTRCLVEQGERLRDAATVGVRVDQHRGPAQARELAGQVEGDRGSPGSPRGAPHRDDDAEPPIGVHTEPPIGVHAGTSIGVRAGLVGNASAQATAVHGVPQASGQGGIACLQAVREPARLRP
jgi:hypothetical protein